MPPQICPHCGAEVPRGARACPECGSDEQTGWSEETNTGGLDLPDDEFNYEEYVKKEFGGGSPKPRGVRWIWWIVAVLIIVGFVVMLIRR